MPFVADNAPRPSRFVPDAPNVYDRVIADSPVGRFAADLDYGPQTSAPTTLAPRTGYQPTTAGKLALRVGVPLAVGVGTGGLGLVPALALTGASGGLGELGAEALEVAGNERQNISLPQVTTAGLLSAVPGVPLGRVASPLLRGGIRVGEGALLGASAPLVQGALEGEMPQMGDVQAGALGGGAFGLPFGAIELLAGARRGVRVPRSANAPEFFPQMDLIPSPREEPMGNFTPNGVPSTAQESALAFARQLPEEIKSAQESANAFMPFLGAEQSTAPTELNAMGQAFRESVPAEMNSVFPTELGDVAAARNAAEAEQAGAAMMGGTVDEVRLRRLAERMAGKTPDDQLAILKQEVKLAGDTLSPAEQRGALNMEQELQRQIDNQNALQEGVEAQQKAAQDAQKAVQDQQKAIEAAQQPPEIPKSEQILAEPTSKPPSIANVATEVATQTKNSPYALQEQLNKMTAAPEVAQAAPAASNALAAPQSTAPAPFEGAVITNANRSGSTIYLSFDITGKIPSAAEVKKAVRDLGYDASVVEFEPNMISTANGEIKFRADIHEKNGPSSSKGAAEVYQNAFGTDKRVSSPTKTQSELSAEERFNKTREYYEQREAGRKPKAVKAPAEQDLKKLAIEQAVSTPETQWQYTVQRGRDGKGGFTQVDAISNGENTVSSNPADLRKAGADIPDVPDWVPQGQYTREQIKDFIKQGEPTNVPTPKPAAANQGAAGKAPATKTILQEAVRNHDNAGGTVQELAERIEGMGDDAPASVRNALDEYRRDAEEDFTKLGMRGDVEAYEGKFEAAVRKAAGKIPGENKPARAPSVKESKVDTTPISSASSEAESVRIGGKMMREAKSEENMRAIQKAMQDYTAPASISSAEQRLNDAGLDLPPISSMSREAKRAELEAGGVKDYNGQPLADLNGAQISNALGKFRRRQLGAISPTLLAPLAGGASGAAYGATQGDTPEERIRNAALFGALGLAGGSVVGAGAKKLVQPKIRQYTSPILKDVAQMLTPNDVKKPLLKRVQDGYNNFRYRFNTRYAPIGQAQRSLFKAANREFVPDSYYDLERSFERVAGAPVQAEGEVELIQNVLDKLPNKNVEDFDTFLTLSRIEDRLIKTGEENAALQDAVGRAQAEVDAAAIAAKANPGQRAYASLAARKEELKNAENALREGFDRKRVGDWTIEKAQQGLADLQQHVGPQAFAQLQQAGREFQDVMKRTLQIQVDAGRLSSELRDRILASNDFYAPFKVLKHFEDEEAFIKGGGTSRIPSQEALAKKITGIDDTDVRIGSPTSTAAEQVYKGYILAEKNKKMRQLATLQRLDSTGEYVKPLGEGMEPRKGYEAVSYLQNGEPKRLEVSKAIADSLNGMDANESDIILRSLGKFAGAFKLGATGMSIPFNLANALVFDPLRLSTISKYGFRGPQDLLYTLYEWPKAFLSSARGNVGQYLGMSPDALYETWIKSGAANSTLARVMNPEAFTARLPKNTKLGELAADTNFGLGTPIKIASLMSNTLEETTKLLGLQRAMRIEKLDSLPPIERQRRWDEIVTELRNYAGSPDFARSGVNMRALNIIMPFTNPRWQGALSDFARINPFRQGNTKDAGAAWARLGSLVAVPSAGLAWYNLSTPENERDYNQIPKQERERYFHIPLYTDPAGKPSLVDYDRGGYYFKNKDGVDIRGYRRIPKREIPGLMANTIEDFVGWAKAESPEAWSQIAANFADNLASSASPISLQGDNIEERMMSAAAGVNPAIRVPVEIGTNRNFFTGRDIVPEGRQKASPELQFSESTPQGYKTVANAMPDALPETLRSPAKLQHITEGMTGGFVRQFAAPQLSPGNPAGETSPLLGRFYRSERVENSDLIKGAQEAERGRTDERIGDQEMAGRLADLVMARTTPEAKQKVLVDAQATGILTPEVFKYLKEDLTDAARGLNYEDRVIKRSYAITGGYRARYFADKLRGMTPEQRGAYLQDQKNKGLLTKEVVGQIQAELNKAP